MQRLSPCDIQKPLPPHLRLGRRSNPVAIQNLNRPSNISDPNPISPSTSTSTATISSKSSKMPRASLLTLPMELHEHICRQAASTRDLKALRLTCREFRLKTETVFTARGFGEVESDLSRDSLENLVALSRNAKYSSKVQVLVIEPRMPVEEGEDGEDIEWVTPVVKKSSAGWSGFPKRREEDLLTDALENFAALQRVEVARYDDPRRFVPKAVEISEDRASLFQGIFGRAPATKTISLSDAFAMVARALQTTRGVSARSFHAGALPANDAARSSINHDAIELNYSHDHRGRRKGFFDISDLHLVLENTAGVAGASCELSLSQFLSQTPHLKSLRLEFWGFAAEWLSETLLKGTFQNLKNVHIEAARGVRTPQMRAFINRHARTLKDITLVNVTFNDDDLTTTFPTLFAHSDLRLSSVRLQQICSQRHGLLLFDKQGVQTVCDPCKADLEAVWKFHQGPKCHHGRLEATGELKTGRVLVERLLQVDMLPWQCLGSLIF